MKEIRSEIIINAPKATVWEAILNIKDYHKWNTFTPKIESTLNVGEDVLLHVNMNNDGKILKQKEELLWIKDGESIAWGIAASFPVKTERAQIVEAIDDQTTRYITYDKFWGILVPVVMLFYRSKIQKGFDVCAADLKRFCERQKE